MKQNPEMYSVKSYRVYDERIGKYVEKYSYIWKCDVCNSIGARLAEPKTVSIEPKWCSNKCKTIYVETVTNSSRVCTYCNKPINDYDAYRIVDFDSRNSFNTCKKCLSDKAKDLNEDTESIIAQIVQDCIGWSAVNDKYKLNFESGKKELAKLMLKKIYRRDILTNMARAFTHDATVCLDSGEVYLMLRGAKKTIITKGSFKYVVDNSIVIIENKYPKRVMKKSLEILGDNSISCILKNDKNKITIIQLV